MAHEVLPSIEELEQIEASEFYKNWYSILNGVHYEVKRAIGEVATEHNIVEISSDSTIR